MFRHPQVDVGPRCSPSACSQNVERKTSTARDSPCILCTVRAGGHLCVRACVCCAHACARARARAPVLGRPSIPMRDFARHLDRDWHCPARISVPYRSGPFRPVPCRAVPFHCAGLRSVAFGCVVSCRVPFRSVPVRSVPVRSGPVRCVPLRGRAGLWVHLQPAVLDRASGIHVPRLWW